MVSETYPFVLRLCDVHHHDIIRDSIVFRLMVGPTMYGVPPIRGLYPFCDFSRQGRPAETGRCHNG